MGRPGNSAAASIAFLTIGVALLSACSAAAATDGLAVGDCVNLSGGDNQAKLVKEPCGSPKSNFKVFAKTATDAECPRDADSSYYAKRGFGRKSQALCLDIDWVVGSCMDVPDKWDGDPVRVDCDDRRAQNKKRVTQVLHDVSTADDCITGLGYPYVDRNFTVCVEELP
ncbi:LppU family putative lipoprotein [Mycobacteroides immunogenum]|uniref:LppU family putative lipoprotein n=1 Tax=Mycobacteroides immunogenum TaxID=83262 RepID=UPI00099435E5